MLELHDQVWKTSGMMAVRCDHLVLKETRYHTISIWKSTSDIFRKIKNQKTFNLAPKPKVQNFIYQMNHLVQPPTRTHRSRSRFWKSQILTANIDSLATLKHSINWSLINLHIITIKSLPSETCCASETYSLPSPDVHHVCVPQIKGNCLCSCTELYQPFILRHYVAQLPFNILKHWRSGVA